jgi:hypothetical protein
MDSNDKLKVALEERKLIQIIIESHETIRMKILGWCITIFTGLTIAFHTDKIALETNKYFIFLGVIIIVFFLIDYVNRTTFEAVIKRSHTVEEFIRTNINNYDGPKIEEAIQNKSAMIKFNFRFLMPYLALFCIAGMSYLAKAITK